VEQAREAIHGPSAAKEAAAPASDRAHGNDNWQEAIFTAALEKIECRVTG
jgi:hypothetical protein